ncbi:MAG: translation initiation factor eIF-2B [Calditrichales bacterium]|nr:MAG: translation initiation factor eIF-2B [Calditrichales bacterium]
MATAMEELKSNNFSGSFEISQESLSIVNIAIIESRTNDMDLFLEEISDLSKEIIKSHPNIVSIRKKISPIIYHMKRMAKAGKSLDEIKSTACQKISETISNAADNLVKIGNAGAKLIQTNHKVLTISSSSIVKEILISARKLRRKFTVYCLESRPQNEGHLLAMMLAEHDIPSVLTTESMMGQVMKDVNMVLCGADRIFENGFVNKTGTLPLVVTAKDQGVPVYMAAETDKIMKEIDRSVRSYPESPTELTDKKHKNLTVLNYYFESVPLDYVHKIICEDGVFDTNEFITWYLKD